MRSRESGSALLLAAVLLGLTLATAFVSGLAGVTGRLTRERASDRALAAAREALVAHASSRPVDAADGPGYLPCPDLDGDGWAESTCGSQDGRTGQAQRLGRLPWKTLGVGRLLDGEGQPLWYAVSSKHKGLLNCSPNAACLAMDPDTALGTITVRDAGGALVHDGRIDDARRAGAGGAAAVVIAAGGNGLDADNRAFVDRNDAAGRALNGDGFAAGAARGTAGVPLADDRIAAVGYDDLMPAVMRRVASEVARCVRLHAARPGGDGRPVAPAPPCRQANPDAPDAWASERGARFGRVPSEVLEACSLAVAGSPGWWGAWRRHVFYAIDVQPVDAAGAPLGARRDFAILVAGAARGAQRRDAPADVDVSQWLEPPHPALAARDPAGTCPGPACAAPPCDRVVLAPSDERRNDVVAASP